MSLSRSLRPLCFLVLLTLPIPLFGQEVRWQDTSLKFIPESASVYSSNLQLERQWTNFIESNAMKRVFESPFVQMGMGQAKELWKNFESQDGGDGLEAVTANANLTTLLMDAISNEIFFYADEDLAKTSKAFGEMMAEINALSINRLDKDLDEDAVMEEFVRKHVPHIPEYIPNFVIGMKISDRKAAENQLDRLDKLIQEGFEKSEDAEPYKDSYSKLTDDGALQLRFQLDGKTFPWDETGALDEMLEDAPEGTEGMIEDMLHRLKLSICVGLVDDYLVIGVGKKPNVLSDLASPKKLLIDKKEFASLRQGKLDLTSVYFASEELMKAPGKKQLSSYFDAFMFGIKRSMKEDLDEDTAEKVMDDVSDDLDMFAQDLLDMLPEQGALLRYTYLTDRGYEGKLYNWGEPLMDGSEPLKLASHLGGNPIMFAVGRSRDNPKAGQMIRKYAGRIDHYMEIMLGEDEDNSKTKKAMQAYRKVRPHFTRLGDVLFDKLGPALGRESALVIDAQAESTQWHPQMPAAVTPLPMIELGMVWNVEDAKQLQFATDELYEIAGDILDVVREEAPEGNEIPDEIPAPVSRSLGDLTMYGYEFPEEWELDSDLVMPNVALRGDTLAMSLMPETTERLITKISVPKEGVLVRLDKPLMGAARFSWSGLLDAVMPWVEYGARLAENENTELIVGQANFAAEVLGCFKDYTSVTYGEDDATVTHFEWHFEDLP